MCLFKMDDQCYYDGCLQGWGSNTYLYLKYSEDRIDLYLRLPITESHVFVFDEYI